MGKKEEDKLRDDLSLHRAMQLDRYLEPPAIDTKAVLDVSTEQSRFGNKIAHAYVVDAKGAPQHIWFQAKRNQLEIDGPLFADPTLALIAYRNKIARTAATRLRDLDLRIAEFVTGSGIIPGVITVKGDVMPPMEEEDPLGERTPAAIGDPPGEQVGSGSYAPGATELPASTAEAVKQIVEGRDDPAAVLDPPTDEQIDEEIDKINAEHGAAAESDDILVVKPEKPKAADVAARAAKKRPSRAKKADEPKSAADKPKRSRAKKAA